MCLRVSAAASLDFLMSHVLRKEFFGFQSTSKSYAPRIWMASDILTGFPACHNATRGGSQPTKATRPRSTGSREADGEMKLEWFGTENGPSSANLNAF